MNKRQLVEHFEEPNHMELYGDHSWYEPMKFIYTALYCALMRNYDTIIVSRNGFRFYTHGKLEDAFLGGEAPVPDPSYRNLLDEMMATDPNVAELCEEIVATNDIETIIRVRCFS
ncbi:hypothetical protein HC928_20475 [bacterium]|nr:hypothetical protein [bacterium]